MIKRPKISKHEIIADLVFFLIAMAISGMAIMIFDYHWSFYPGETILPPSKHIFKTAEPYYIGIPLGGIVGFLIIKLLYFAFSEEEKADEEIRGKKGELTLKIKKGKTYLE